MIGKRLLIYALAIMLSCSTLPATEVAQKVDSGIESTKAIEIAEGFDGGTGTEDDPYEIATAEQLSYLAKQVNSGTTYEGEFIKLTTDIVLNDTSNYLNWADTPPQNEWTPIGYYVSEDDNHMFSGTFDGGGYTISGLYINMPDADRIGLFGYASNATFMNVVTDKSYVIGNNYGGALVGSCLGENGEITRCFNDGYVYCSEVVAGGIVGNTECPISLCANGGFVAGAYLVGGIVGSSSSSVTTCYNTGDVDGTAYCGGIAGIASEGLTECYSIGPINCTNNSGGISGGYCTVSNCYYIQQDGMNDSGTPLTSDQMLNQDVYVGFDFENVWTMVGESFYVYPELIWMAPLGELHYDNNYSGGSGSKRDPYLIRYTHQFEYFAQQVNAGRRYESLYFKLVADISLNDTSNFANWTTQPPARSWEPVGVVIDIYDRHFHGTFDGNNHTISGAYINVPTGQGVGLFGVITDAEIRNLTLKDSLIIGYLRCGGIVGVGVQSTVRNCVSYATVLGLSNVGGVAGHCTNVINCQGRANVGNTPSESFASCVGGIIGGGYAERCTNFSDVSATTVVGGIAGYGDVAKCINFGNVTGSSTKVGGICGDSLNAIECINFGSVTGTTKIGGIVGTGGARNCANVGDVSGTSDIGGIMGVSTAEGAELCYNVGNISCDASVLGVYGGISGSDDCTVTNCYYLETVVSGYNYNSIGTALTNEEAYMQSSYVGFDFEKIWRMHGMPDYLYPKLRFMEGFMTVEVAFIDGFTNEIISVAEVDYGADAVFPTPPEHDGYTFVGWDSDGINITDYTEITAQYEVTPTPTPTQEPTPTPTQEPTPTPTQEPTPTPTQEPTPTPTQEPTPTPTQEPTPTPTQEPTPTPTQEPTPTPTQEPTPTPTQEPTPTPVILTGDVNGDGTINTGDAVIILRSTVDLITLTEDQLIAADFNGDGHVNTGDAVRVLVYCVTN